MNDAVSRPLAGMLVVDLVAGPLAAIGRTLAELGADVVRVEPPQGLSDRAADPLSRQGLAFAANNLGKRSLVVDLRDAASAARLDALLARADILIDDAGPEASLKLDISAIRARHQALVTMSVSDFGTGHDHAHWRATDPVLHALSSELARSGLDGRAPLPPPGDIAWGTSSSQAIFTLLVAHINRLKTGLADHLDFSALEGTHLALDPGYGVGGSAAAGKRPTDLPRGRPPRGIMYPIIPCADGRVRICVLAPRQWQNMHRWMGSPEEFADPKYNKLNERFGSPTLLPAIAKFFADKTRSELEQEAEVEGIPLSGVLSLEEALKSDHVEAREGMVTLEIAPGVSTRFPNGMVVIDGQRMGPRGPAPTLGELNAPTLGGAFVFNPDPVLDGDRPLSGLKVLDLGVIVVGAEQGRLLADQGADVVKVEAKAFPDGARQAMGGEVLTVSFAAGHRNERSLGLNLKSPEGKALFLKLAAEADVILSNFKAGTIESLGFGYDVVSAINERIIMSDSSAFGPTGPWSKRMGYGPLVRASSGMTELWRYEDDPESFSDSVTIYPDHTAGRYGAIGVLALIIRRMRTGRGGTITLSQAEVMMGHLATGIAGNGIVPAGHPDAPWDVFPTQGEDDWCVVTVRGDADFKALCGVIGRADLASDPSLATAEGRLANSARIDAAVTDWLAGQTARGAMEQLQEAGVPAGAMLRVSELPDFPIYAQRGIFRTDRHPLIADEFKAERFPVKAKHLPDPASGPAPVMGEHSREVVADWLGLSDVEIDLLVAQEALELVEQKMAAE